MALGDGRHVYGFLEMCGQRRLRSVSRCGDGEIALHLARTLAGEGAPLERSKVGSRKARVPRLLDEVRREHGVGIVPLATAIDSGSAQDRCPASQPCHQAGGIIVHHGDGLREVWETCVHYGALHVGARRPVRGLPDGRRRSMAQHQYLGRTSLYLALLEFSAVVIPSCCSAVGRNGLATDRRFAAYPNERQETREASNGRVTRRARSVVR